MIISLNKIVINVRGRSDTIQATTTSPPVSHTVGSSALRSDTTPSSNKGKGSSSSHHRAHGVRSDMGGSSSSRTKTAPPSSKRRDNSTKYLYPSPESSSPPSRIFYQSPPGSPEVLSQGYQSSLGLPPFPKTLPSHRQGFPFQADAPQMAYPSPANSEQSYSGPYHGTGQRGYMQDGYPPQSK